MDERQQAAEALATARVHQERARRAARLPVWVYAAMFVLSAGGAAVNDFVGVGGARLVAMLVMVMLVVVLAATFVGDRSALLSRVRGVQRQQPFVPWAFGVVVIAAAIGAWLISAYGPGFAGSIADGIGLRDYPDTVAGVLYGAAFTALFALSQLLTSSQRRPNP
ncbi:hypothetical protein [Actinomadura sp. DC4]|uniref:hypothetical protein n=1 Tax=Actinomadura sp. DC4 TaxID=3055069 RepID=UPI0025B1062D|nr:hypothetical protein [Actinomadura sp. DC4]MDN3353150.1 hypothetical protein [Actinomadura sp. DC4]